VDVAGDVAHAETAVALTVGDVGAEVVEPEAGAGTLPADRTELWLDLHAPTTLTATRNAMSRASRRTLPILSPPAHQSSSDSERLSGRVHRADFLDGSQDHDNGLRCG